MKRALSGGGRRGSAVTPKGVLLLSTAVYFIFVPILQGTGNGYFTIMSLVPVIAVGLMQGKTRGVQAAAVFTVVNLCLVWIIEGSLASMTAAGGVMGTASLFTVGWLVGYLRDLSQRRLQDMVEDKDRLIGTISHELRTPLSTVLGMSFELSDRLDSFTSEEIAEFAGMIAQQSLELEALIEDLLVAARADIERIKVARIPVDLSEVVARAVAVTTTSWDESIPIQVWNGDGPVVALGDGLRVRQIVRNLLQNAHRYGGADVQVTTSRNGHRCVVTVSDDGGGVKAHRVESIFEPHVRAHTAGGSTDSLGLGLYVSRTLANLMGGSLEYRREDDRTHFDLILPAAEEAGRPIRIATGSV